MEKVHGKHFRLVERKFDTEVLFKEWVEDLKEMTYV